MEHLVHPQSEKNRDPIMISTVHASPQNLRRKVPARRADRLRQAIELPAPKQTHIDPSTPVGEELTSPIPSRSRDEIRSPGPFTSSTQKALGQLRKHANKPTSAIEVRTPIKSSPITSPIQKTPAEIRMSPLPSSSQKTYGESRRYGRHATLTPEMTTPTRSSPLVSSAQKIKQPAASLTSQTRGANTEGTVRQKSSWREEQRNLELQARFMAGTSAALDTRSKPRSSWREERDNYDLQDGKSGRSARQYERRIEPDEVDVVITKPPPVPPTPAEMEEIRAKVQQVMISSEQVMSEYNNAATKIASLYRGTKARGQYRLHANARTIQKVWRGVGPRRAKKAILFRLEIENNAATMIQSVRRMVTARRILTKFKAVRTIQAAWRGFHPRTLYWSYLRNMAAATLIQSAWRSFKCSYQYMMDVQDIVTVQGVARGYISRRRQYRSMKAVDIQRVFRGHKGRKVFARVRHKYLMYCSARSIQSIVRGRRVRAAVKEARFLIHSATTIQKYWRCYTAQQTFWSCVGSAIMIQSVLRARAERKGYLVKLSCVLTMQCYVRQWLAYCELQRLRQARKEDQSATCIQASWRGYKDFQEYSQYKISKAAATKIQAAWRSFICFSDFVFIVADVVSIQRRVRVYLRRQHAAIAIQATWRMFTCFTDFSSVLQDVFTIQRMIRGHQGRVRYAALHEEREKQRALLRFREACAIDIQRIYRGSSDRTKAALLRLKNRQLKAAIAMQSLWRSYVVQGYFIHTIASVIQIQRIARGFLGRLQFIDDLGCVILCQCAVRRWRAIRVKSQLSLQVTLTKAAMYHNIMERHAANTIQSWFRSHVRPKIYFHAASKVQAFFRMVRAIIEREVRAEMKRRKETTRRRKEGAITIQSFWRVMMAKAERRSRAESKLRVLAAVKIQCIFRMIYSIMKREDLAAIEQSRRYNAAATKVQSFFRMVKAMVDREIQEQLQRRKIRKMLKNRTKELDDLMLEVAWVSMSTSYDTILTSLLPRPAVICERDDDETTPQPTFSFLEIEQSTSGERMLEEAWKSMPESQIIRKMWSSMSVSDESVLEAKRSAVEKVTRAPTKQPSKGPSPRIGKSRTEQSFSPSKGITSKETSDVRLRSRSSNVDKHTDKVTAGSAPTKMRLPPSSSQGRVQSLENPPAHLVRLSRPKDDSDAMSEVSGITAASTFLASQPRLQSSAPAPNQKLGINIISFPHSNDDKISLTNANSVKNVAADMGKRHFRSRSRSREPRSSLE